MAIDFQKVDFKYNELADKKTLSNVSFSINEKDEFVAILGHTGSGKSTIAQLMNCLLLPSDGQITIYGQPIILKKKTIVRLNTRKNDCKYSSNTSKKGLFAKYQKPIYYSKLKEIRSHSGLVFQFPEYQLFEDSVVKDISFGPKNFGKTNEEALSIAKDCAKMVGLPEKLWDKSPFALSGGQMRRVAIAGILALNPDILIFDEPTVGLDPVGKNELVLLLQKIQRETHKSIIMISHDMNIVARVAKRIIVMKEGNLVYDGDKYALFDDEELLHSFNLDLPECAMLAKSLKEKKLIDYQRLPLTKEELLSVILSEKEVIR